MKISFGIKLFCWLITKLCLHQIVNAEVFTALVEMEELLETENALINNLEKYIDVQEKKLEFLKLKMQEYKKEHTEAALDVSEYLSNPINAYLLTKRLTSDWKQVEELMAHDVGSAFLENVTNYRNILKFPSDEDLNGAAVALIRLQDTYNLDTSSVARGELNGVQYSTKMSSNDCFELGRQSYNNQDYYHTVLWMHEAMQRLLFESNDTLSASKVDILEYLAFSTYKQGNIKRALELTNDLLDLVPNHDRASGNKIFYEKEISDTKRRFQNKMKGDDGSPFVEKANIPSGVKLENPTDGLSERKVYEMLCRGEIQPAPKHLAPLRCRYYHGNSAFLLIAPFKVEEAYHDPLILIFHDVMYDNEIDVIKKLAKPRFRRATVQNSKTGELEVAHYRISKSAWLRNEDDLYVSKVVQRIEDMTDLNMETAEELQVVNYGIGGHYEPHFDFARKDERNAFKSLGTGNRIATVLFYMSDVEQGGATVFTAIRTAIYPKKGTAAFWFNLHASGEGDYRTRHAACPVLAGTKWVANKWIHERGQEFRRKCGLLPDYLEYESQIYI